MLERVLFREERVTMSREEYELLLAELRGLKEQVRLIDRQTTMLDVELYEMQERLMDAVYRRVEV
jgi:hypothetical protein